MLPQQRGEKGGINRSRQSHLGTDVRETNRDHHTLRRPNEQKECNDRYTAHIHAIMLQRNPMPGSVADVKNP